MRLTSSSVGGRGCVRVRALDRIVDTMEQHKRLPEQVRSKRRRRDAAIAEGRHAFLGSTSAPGLLRGDRGRNK